MYEPMTQDEAGEVDAYTRGLLNGSVEINNVWLWGMNQQANVRCIDVLAVGDVFLKGFAAASEGRLELSPLLRTWMKGPKTRERSGRLVANMVAVQLCAELDSYLPNLASFGSEYSPDFRARRGGLWEELNSERQGNRERSVDSVLRPSAKRWARWPEKAMWLFRLDAEPTVVRGLRDLAGARTCAAHENHDHVFAGEHLSMWFVCCRWLIDRATWAVDSLVARDAGQAWYGKQE